MEGPLPARGHGRAEGQIRRGPPARRRALNTVPTFDLFVAVDWSARSVPGPARPSSHSCWVAWTEAEGGTVEAAYFRTRRAAEEHVRALVQGRSALVGFDFVFGYPRGSGLGGGVEAAARLAALIEDGPDNANNRFMVAAELNRRLGDGRPGPFWGGPDGAPADLPRTRPRDPPFPEYRLAEARLRRNRAFPHSVWKLAGAGAVGSQTLLGLPMLHRLRADTGARIWPFETGWNRDLSGVVLAEIWPGLPAVAALARGLEGILDERQVKAVCLWLARAQGEGRLAALLGRPDGLSEAENAACLAEEGWIVGAA